MLKLIAGYVRGIVALAPPWWIWVALIGLVNGVAPVFFWPTPEAVWVLVALLIAVVIQLVILRTIGFVRLMGIAHILVWAPLLPWLWTRLGEVGTAGMFGKWLAAVLIIDVISLLIDIVDVLRYAIGDRTPSVTIESR